MTEKMKTKVKGIELVPVPAKTAKGRYDYVYVNATGWEIDLGWLRSAGGRTSIRLRKPARWPVKL